MVKNAKQKLFKTKNKWASSRQATSLNKDPAHFTI